jgi:hypothetical protein
MFAFPTPLSRLSDRIALDIRSIEPMDGDWRVIARLRREG